MLPENDNVQFHQSQGLARWYYSEFVIFHESAWDTGLIIVRGIDGGSAVASSEYLSGLFLIKKPEADR